MQILYRLAAISLTAIGGYKGLDTGLLSEAYPYFVLGLLCGIRADIMYYNIH